MGTSFEDLLEMDRIGVGTVNVMCIWARAPARPDMRCQLSTLALHYQFVTTAVATIKTTIADPPARDVGLLVQS